MRRVAPIPGGPPIALEQEHCEQLCADKGRHQKFLGGLKREWVNRWQPQARAERVDSIKRSPNPRQ